MLGLAHVGVRLWQCYMGIMYFGNFRKKSVKIGHLIKFRMPSGKRRMHSVSGRHDDDR